MDISVGGTLSKLALVLAVSLTLSAVTAAAEPREKSPGIQTVYIVPMSHIDVGFTAPPLAVAEGAVRHTEQALELARKDPDYVWNFEVFWELDQWLNPDSPPGFPPTASKTPGGIQPSSNQHRLHEVLDLVRQGRFGIGAAYINPHSSLMSAWALDQLFRVPAEWGRKQGLTLDWAAINDVPGHPHDLPKYCAANGIRYLLLGTNQSLSKRLPESVCNTPFWWEAPDGSRVLTWISGNNSYTGAFTDYGVDPGTAKWFNKKEFTQTEPLEAMRHGMNKLRNEYGKRDYPYDAVVLMHAFDNWDAGAAGRLPAAVKLWNESVGEPRLVLATPREYFQHIEKNYGSQLPVHRGGFGGQWELVRMTAPDAMSRARAREAQIIASGNKPDLDEIRRLLVYWEHSYSLNTPWPGHLTRQEAVAQNRQQWSIVADWPMPQPLPSTGQAVQLPKVEAGDPLQQNSLYLAKTTFIEWKGFSPLPPEAWLDSRAERLDDAGVRCRHRIDRRKLPDQAHVIWAWKLNDAEAAAPVIIKTAGGTMRWPEEGLGGYAQFHWVAPWGFEIGETRFTPHGAFAFARPAEHPGWLLCYFLGNNRSATFKGGEKGKMTFKEVYQGEEPIHEFVIDISPVSRSGG